MRTFSEDTKISVALAYASGSADRNGAIIDMKGWDGVMFIVTLATIAAGGTNSLKLQQGDESDLSDAADLEGTGVTIADDDDDEIKYIDLRNPRERYVRLVVDKDASNACAESVLAIQYRGKTGPVSAHGTGVEGELHVAPAEGTA